MKKLYAFLALLVMWLAAPPAAYAWYNYHLLGRNYNNWNTSTDYQFEHPGDNDYYCLFVPELKGQWKIGDGSRNNEDGSTLGKDGDFTFGTGYGMTRGGANFDTNISASGKWVKLELYSDGNNKNGWLESSYVDLNAGLSSAEVRGYNINSDGGSTVYGNWDTSVGSATKDGSSYKIRFHVASGSGTIAYMALYISGLYVGGATISAGGGSGSCSFVTSAKPGDYNHRSQITVNNVQGGKEYELTASLADGGHAFNVSVAEVASVSNSYTIYVDLSEATGSDGKWLSNTPNFHCWEGSTPIVNNQPMTVVANTNNKVYKYVFSTDKSLSSIKFKFNVLNWSPQTSNEFEGITDGALYKINSSNVISLKETSYTEPSASPAVSFAPAGGSVDNGHAVKLTPSNMPADGWWYKVGEGGTAVNVAQASSATVILRDDNLAQGSNENVTISWGVQGDDTEKGSQTFSLHTPKMSIFGLFDAGWSTTLRDMTYVEPDKYTYQYTKTASSYNDIEFRFKKDNDFYGHPSGNAQKLTENTPQQLSNLGTSDRDRSLKIEGLNTGDVVTITMYRDANDSNWYTMYTVDREPRVTWGHSAGYNYDNWHYFDGVCQATVTLTPSNMPSGGWWYKVGSAAKVDVSDLTTPVEINLGKEHLYGDKGYAISWGVNGNNTAKETRSYTVRPYQWYIQGLFFGDHWENVTLTDTDEDGVFTCTFTPVNSEGALLMLRHYPGAQLKVQDSSTFNLVTYGSVTKDISYETNTGNMPFTFIPNEPVHVAWDGTTLTLSQDVPPVGSFSEISYTNANHTTASVVLTMNRLGAGSGTYTVTCDDVEVASGTLAAGANTITFGDASASADKTYTISWEATGALPLISSPVNNTASGSQNFTLVYRDGSARLANAQLRVHSNDIFNEITNAWGTSPTPTRVSDGLYVFRITAKKSSDVYSSIWYDGKYNGPSDNNSLTTVTLGDPNYTTLIYSSTDQPGEGKNGQQFRFSVEAGKTYGVYLQENAEGKFEIRIERDIKVNMPLTRKSFFEADGTTPRSRYFLVGSRLGDWHLQPEWELKKVDATHYAITDGRIMYSGWIGIAKVDSYDDYIEQRYTLYSRTDLNNLTFWVTKDNHYIGGFIDNRGKVQAYVTYPKKDYDTKADRRFHDGNATFMVMDGSVSDGKGCYLGKIEMVVNGSGDPTSIDFIEYDPTVHTNVKPLAEERVFTLVGNSIKNDRIYDAYPAYKTVMDQSKIRPDMHDWQEAFIQYDSEGEPYYDANGQYVYQTVFQNSWLKEHPSYFANAKDGDYEQFMTSTITFVNTDNIDTTNDPYRTYYTNRPSKGAFTSTPKNITFDGDIYNYTETLEGKASQMDFYHDEKTNTDVAIEASDWECYVVKNVRLKGMLKVWTGGGGNATPYERGEGETLNRANSDLARWNADNGGYDNDGSGTSRFDASKGEFVSTGGEIVKVINSYDITVANGNVVAYAQEKGGKNYLIGDGKTETFFNRIILWYPKSGGDMSNSVIQFITELCSPQIVVSGVTADEGGLKKNQMLDYSWKIANVEAGDEASLNRAVESWTVKRYQVTKDGNVFQANVASSDADDMTVSNFTANQNDRDRGALVGSTYQGLAPGTYVYEIVVDYGNGVSKSAMSNPYTIYNPDRLKVSPKAYAVQVLNLTAKGKEALGNITQSKLTYRPEGDASTYYAFDVDEQGHLENLLNVNDSKVTSKVLPDPEAYYWTSDYFVRALDLTAFNNTMNQLRDNRYINDVDNPNPTITVTEPNNPANGSFTCGTYEITNSKGETEQYKGVLVTRGGSLQNALFQVAMTYTVDGNQIPTSDHMEIIPVVPFTYGLSYSYANDAEPAGETLEFSDVPSAFDDATTYEGTDGYSNMGTGYYGTHDLTFEGYNKRALNCTFTFAQPNVAEDILTHYQIHYDITLDNDNDNVSFLKQGVYVDDAVASLDEHYSFLVKNVHPDEGINPRLKINSVTYVRNGDDSRTLKAKYHYAGQVDEIVGASVFMNKKDPSFTGLYINPVKYDNHWDWQYQGHDTFNESEEYAGTGDHSALLSAEYYDVEVRIDPNSTFFASIPDSYFAAHPEYYPGGVKKVYFHFPCAVKHDSDSYYCNWAMLKAAEGETNLAAIRENPSDRSNYKGSKILDPLIGALFGPAFPAGNNSGTSTDPTNKAYLDAFQMAITPVYVFYRNPDMPESEEVNGLTLLEDLSTPSTNLGAPRRAPEENATAQNVLMRSKAIIIGQDKGIAGTTGIENVGYDAAYTNNAAEYYNIQGVKIEHPQPGQVYIVRRGAAVTKEILK